MLDPTYSGKMCKRCTVKHKNFGEPNGVATHCASCKAPYYVDVRNAMCVVCGKTACYGMPTDKRPSHCAKDAPSGMVNIKTKHCACGSGKKPSLGAPSDTKATRCGSCQQSGDVNVITKRCEGCHTKQPSFALPGQKPRFCLQCSKPFPGMVNVKAKKGSDLGVSAPADQVDDEEDVQAERDAESEATEDDAVVDDTGSSAQPTSSDALFKCSNCSRQPQPLSEFVNDSGMQLKTCRKCRDKGKRMDHKRISREDGTRADYKKAYFKEHRPDVKHREKKRAEDEAGYLAHNAAIHRQWHASNREHVAEWCRNNFNRRWASIEAGAKDRGITLEITKEDYEQMTAMSCFYCDQTDPEQPFIGLDRLDNTVGYHNANVVPCCSECNNMKRCLDPRSFMERCADVAFAQEHQQESVLHPDAWTGSESASPFYVYRAMASTRGRAFLLTRERFEQIVEQPCTYCRTTSRTRGVDRVDNARGYELDNVVAACSGCNYLKGKLTTEAFFNKCRIVSSTMDAVVNKLPTSVPRQTLAITKS